MPAPPFVPVGTFLTHIEADLARTALEAAGIEAVLRQDDCGGVEPALWINGLTLVVNAEDAAAATDVLNSSAVSDDDESDASEHS
jgi:hypothetical protein